MNSSFKINPKRCLFIGQDFTANYVDKLIEKLFKLNQEKGLIYFQIDSNGGSIRGAKRLFENIKLSPNKIIGVVIGDCFSAAAIILQACYKRYASPLSKFGVHYVKYNFSFEANKDKPLDFYVNFLRKDFEIIKRNNKFIFKTLKEKLNIKNNEIESLLKDETELDAKEAHKIGFIDEIIKF